MVNSTNKHASSHVPIIQFNYQYKVYMLLKVIFVGIIG